MSTDSTPSLWEIRKAVKPWLSDSSQTVLFGCSGGADSMALALALFLEANGTKVIPIVVDHGLQPGSAEITTQTISKLKDIGYTQIESAPPEHPNKIVWEESLSQCLTALRISQSEGVLAVFIPRRLDPTPVRH